MGTSQATTRGICIEVASAYVAERSDPEAGQWFFTYEVRIANQGQDTVQLLSRHWIITDADGRVEEVRGPGVVGEQPTLPPGEEFRYMSACPLPTAFGTMEGSYQMVDSDGVQFDAAIAPFSLAEPHAVN